MGTKNVLWNCSKKAFTFGLIGLTVSDRYGSIAAVRGSSMSPTFNPDTRSLTGMETCKKLFHKFSTMLTQFIVVSFST